jgi:Sulfotransferase family
MNVPGIREAPRKALGQRPKVIYVLGAGRSGSTVLGVALGNCEGVFFAGELDAWLPRSGEPQLGGEERTRFWGTVLEEVGPSELFGWEAQRTLERSLALFRVHMWRARRRLQKPYRRLALDLYRAVSSASGEMTIVDSSHYPLRARELQSLHDEIDLYLLFLIRDPQSVVASFNRNDVPQYRKSTLTTNVYLWVTNLLAGLVFLKHPRERRLLLRYEDFAAEPETALRRILAMVGASGPLPSTSSLRTGIPFQGNRLIKSEVIALEPALAPARGSRITAVLQLPWSLVLRRLSGRSPKGGTSGPAHRR